MLAERAIRLSMIVALPLDLLDVSLLNTLLRESRELSTSPILVRSRD